MRLRNVVLLSFFVAVLLIGCGVPRTITPPPAQPPQQEPVVEAVEVVSPVVVQPNETEFEQTKRRLIERGILKETTSVYRVGEVVETDENIRFTLYDFFWDKHEIFENRIIVLLRFFGEDERDEKERQEHRVRLIIDDKEHLPSLATRSGAKDTKAGHFISYRFSRWGIPEPGVYSDYVLVFIKLGVSPEEEAQHRLGPRRPEAMDGDIAFIFEREDMVIGK